MLRDARCVVPTEMSSRVKRAHASVCVCGCACVTQQQTEYVVHVTERLQTAVVVLPLLFALVSVPELWAAEA